MAEFVNTRTTLGEQATIDGLVDHSLTELKEDGCYVLASYGINHNPTLQTVEFPNLTTLNIYALCNNTALTTVKIGGYNSSSALTVSANAFNGCANLEHLVIDRPVMATLSATSAFTGTKITRKVGAIYVPSSLVDTYKANTNWGNYIIFPISSYPASSYDTISDSWATINTNANYANDYNVGDVKSLTLTDDTELAFVLVAKDTDTLSSDGTSKARMTWISRDIYTTHRMNATATTSGGWAESEMRSWLISDVLPLFPSDIQAMMKPVNKTYRTKSPNDETLSIADTIWIPSYKEVGYTNTTYVESDGVVYSGIFSSNSRRIKYNASGTVTVWWLRSPGNATSFCGVNLNGNNLSSDASSPYGVVLGFCI